MASRFYTIGMAGHIDHGKTELTKALTQVDTDRLQAEKQRRISIEIGYAPFQVSETVQASIIDVPGHEKFIRQMIAGVAGIDLVLIVISADEGVMPQTREHLEILSFLGIHCALIVVTKCDIVEAEWLELVKEDVDQAVRDTPFENADLQFVDSVSGSGIPDLTRKIKETLEQVPRKQADGPFRLPIDQVFTIQGQGTIVRGTVFEGRVQASDMLRVLPVGKEVRVRQIQVQHETVHEARAGQRAALNLGGISRHQINRGDVLVALNDDFTTQRVDVSLRSVSHVHTPLKQRAPLKIHIGTAIVMGKIIFFDRNEMGSNEEVFCQLQLNEPVSTRRGERLIIRRPSPVETFGGGSVIDAQAGKHRFGEDTVNELSRKKEGTPEDRIVDILREHSLLSRKELMRQSGLGDDTLDQALQDLQDSEQIEDIGGNSFVLTEVFVQEQQRIMDELKSYHERYLLRSGMDKAEIVQPSSVRSTVVEKAIADLKNNGQIKQNGPYLAMFDFQPSIPDKWVKPIRRLIDVLRRQELQVENWQELVHQQSLPDDLSEDLKHYLLQQDLALKLDDFHLVHQEAVQQYVEDLFQETGGNAFTLQEAKRVLGLSRKYLVPFLELLDGLKYTLRSGNERRWLTKKREGNEKHLNKE